MGGGKGKPQTCPGGISEDSSEKARPIAKLKCLHTNVCSVGNKQEEIETGASWLCKDLQLKLREKKETYRKWKQGCVSCRNTELLSVCVET